MVGDTQLMIVNMLDVTASGFDFDLVDYYESCWRNTPAAFLLKLRTYSVYTND